MLFKVKMRTFGDETKGECLGFRANILQSGPSGTSAAWHALHREYKRLCGRSWIQHPILRSFFLLILEQKGSPVLP